MVVVVPVWFVEPLSNEIVRSAARAEAEETRETPDADEVVEEIFLFVAFWLLTRRIDKSIKLVTKLFIFN